MIDPKAVPLLILKEKSLFIKIDYVFPECKFLIKGADQLYPFRCFVDSCPRNSNCMGRLVPRLQFLFDQFPVVQIIYLYFAYPDKPGSTRSGVFWRDFREPEYILFNRAYWNKVKKESEVFEMVLPDYLFLGEKKKEIIELP